MTTIKNLRQKQKLRLTAPVSCRRENAKLHQTPRWLHELTGNKDSRSFSGAETCILWFLGYKGIFHHEAYKLCVTETQGLF